MTRSPRRGGDAPRASRRCGGHDHRRWCLACRRQTRRARGDEGFGLIDVLVAFVLLMLVVTPMAYLLGSVLQQTSNNRASVEAGLIAEKELEEAHAVLSAVMTSGSQCLSGGLPSLPCTIAEPDQTVQKIDYAVHLEFDWALIGNAQADVCTSGQIPQVVSAQATVSWGPAKQSVSESSIVNLPYIAVSPTDGYLAVQIDNASGGGTPGVSVLVSDPNASPPYSPPATPPVTDRNGCAFITLPESATGGSDTGYTVTLQAPSGSVYVDGQENPSPSQASQVVVTGGVTEVQFNYDRAATISMTYPSVTGVEEGVQCPLKTLCIASGQQASQTSTGTGLVGGPPVANLLVETGGAWSRVSLPSLARLQALACPTSSECVGVGSGTDGGAASFVATYDNSTWTFSSVGLPSGVKDLSSLACPSSTECDAVGYGLNGTTYTGVLLTLAGTSWTSQPVSGATTLASLACTSSSTCLATGTNGTAPALFTLDVATHALAPVTSLSPAPSELGSVTCPVGAGGTCFVAGAASGATTIYVTPDAGTTWSTVSGIPTSWTTTGTPVCPATNTCLVPAGSHAAPGSGTVLTLTATTQTSGTTTTTSWAATAPKTFPGTVQWVSAVACSNSSTCYASAATTGSSAAAPSAGAVLVSTDGGVDWSTATLPTSVDPLSFSGVACATNSLCDVVGESLTGDVVEHTGDGGWQVDNLPAQGTNETGVVGAGWGASVANTQLSPAGVHETVPAAAAPVTPSSPDAASTGPVFPYQTGYAIWPGGCQLEAAPGLPVVAVSPGGTATATASLADLRLAVVNGAGQPVPGAVVTAQEANTAKTAQCPIETFGLPVTDASGRSAAGFSFGTYTLKIANPVSGTTTSVTITVGNDGVSETTSGGTSVTYPYPDPVSVVAP